MTATEDSVPSMKVPAFKQLVTGRRNLLLAALASLSCLVTGFASAQTLSYSPRWVDLPGTLPVNVAVGRSDVFVADYDAGVVRWALRQNVLSGDPVWPSVRLEGYSAPSAVATRPDHHLFVAARIDDAMSPTPVVLDLAPPEYWPPYAVTPALPVVTTPDLDIYLADIRDLELDADGNLWALDAVHNRLLRLMPGGEWEVIHTERDWSTPLGFGLSEPASDGAFDLWVAGSGSHSIFHYSVDAAGSLGGGDSPDRFGFYGQAGQLLFDQAFNNPRDVAVLSSAQIVVADTLNARLGIYGGSDYGPRRFLGGPDFFQMPVNVAVDFEGNLFALDQSRGALFVYPVVDRDVGTELFDLMVRDDEHDAGVEPYSPSSAFAAEEPASPDILVRNYADIDDLAEFDGARSQRLSRGRVNFAYVAVTNIGPEQSYGGAVHLRWSNPDASTDFFGLQWSGVGRDAPNDTRGMSVFLRLRDLQAGERTLMGPFVIWPPDDNEDLAADSSYTLIAMVSHRDDPHDPEQLGDPLDVFRSNNFAARRVMVSGSPPTGPQNTLVIHPVFLGEVAPDIDDGWCDRGGTWGLVDEWLYEASYQRASLRCQQRVVSLTETRTHYEKADAVGPDERTFLIDMVEDAIQVLHAEEPGLFAGPTASPEDDIERIIAMISGDSVSDMSTTGAWVFDLVDGCGRDDSGESCETDSDCGPGGRCVEAACRSTCHRAFTASAIRRDATIGYQIHALGHQLGMIDLYLYEGFGELVPDPLDVAVLAGWDPMGWTRNPVHPLQWHKTELEWANPRHSPGEDERIIFIARPGRGAELSPDHCSELSGLWREADGDAPGRCVFAVDYSARPTPGGITGIAISLTTGAATYDESRHHVWVEARRSARSMDGEAGPDEPAWDPSVGDWDAQVNGDHVVVTRVNERIPQGQGTAVLVTTMDVGSPTPDELGGIELRVLERDDNHTGYDVEVSYVTPDEDVCVSVAGDRAYTIFVDNGPRIIPSYAFADGTAEPPSDGGDPLVAGEQNRIYAIVSNDGGRVVHGIEVWFSASSPFHTLGGAEIDFNLHLGVARIPVLGPGERRVTPPIIWVPDVPSLEGADGMELIRRSHHCIRAEVRFDEEGDDINPADNWEQRNMQAVASTRASPYSVERFPFVMRGNEAPTLHYFTVDGVPESWRWWFDQDSALIGPEEEFLGNLRFQPPPSEPACQDMTFEVTSWTPMGDTLVREGGTRIDASLREEVDLEFWELAEFPCECALGASNDERCWTLPSKFEGLEQPQWVAETGEDECVFVVAKVCMSPSEAGTEGETLIIFVDPSGNPYYQTAGSAVTEYKDLSCVSAAHWIVTSGSWRVDGYYPGTACPYGPDLVSHPFEIHGINENVNSEDPSDQDGDRLPDHLEIQGDDDSDGIPNHLDQDSDGDGPKDCEDSLEDCDQDGIPDMIDPDSAFLTCPTREPDAPLLPSYCIGYDDDSGGDDGGDDVGDHGDDGGGNEGGDDCFDGCGSCDDGNCSVGSHSIRGVIPAWLFLIGYFAVRRRRS